MWNNIYFFVFTFSLYVSQSRAETMKTENGVVQNELPKRTQAIDVITVIKLLLENGKQNDCHEKALKRVKRQGAGKFADAADVTETKQMRLFATMFGNIWSKSPSGGQHPLHPRVPKPVVLLFKQKIANFFFPPNKGSKMKEKD